MPSCFIRNPNQFAIGDLFLGEYFGKHQKLLNYLPIGEQRIGSALELKGLGIFTEVTYEKNLAAFQELKLLMCPFENFEKAVWSHLSSENVSTPVVN
ncbi:hypothetical protein NPIL_573341 [Nephila pilipes]|uniref:Uncharacterized protein n=1 Tax=Nephila pilipes TaxID=299642 RepID=A0A8X6TW27_NEPPI|nr:hypothetical protein NPIL_573341 [Nephila pilipes]